MDNSTPDMYSKLVRYLDGELTGEEKDALEQQLGIDPALQEEFANLRLAREAVRQYGLRKQVAAIHDSMIKELRPPVRRIGSVRRVIRYSVAVAAAIVLIVGSFLAYKFYTLSPNKVFASRYQSYELITTRGNDKSDKPIEKAYREKNYQEVKRIHKTGEDNSVKAEFLNGMASLETSDQSGAIRSFNEVLTLNKQSAKPVMDDEAEYYLALAYLKNRDYDLSLALLEKIRDEKDHLYHSKVTTKFIRQLKWLKSR